MVPELRCLFLPFRCHQQQRIAVAVVYDVKLLCYIETVGFFIF